MYQAFPNGRRWQVDLQAAARVGLGLQRLTLEVEEMGRAFPRWLLSVAVGNTLQTCRCHGLLVFDRGLRCVMCDRAHRPEGELAWFGLLPPIGIDGLTQIKDKLLRDPPPRHLTGQQAGLGSYLLVPLLAVHLQPVSVFYLPEFARITSLSPSHEIHMLGGGQMCLFGSGEWQPEMTCREVLQQRAYGHVIKLLNYANGKRNAFALVTK